MNILKSLVMILALAIVAAGATSSVFTDKEAVASNTFSTGEFEIKINRLTRIPFQWQNAAPGTLMTGEFMIKNTAPSTLSARSLKLSAVKGNGSDDLLYNNLRIKIEAKRGSGDWQLISGAGGNGWIFLSSISNGFTNLDLLGSHWNELAVGASERIRCTMALPADANNDYQKLSASFDFVVDAASWGD